MNKKYLLKLTLLLLIGLYACNNPSTPNPSHKLHIDTVAVMVADCYFIEGEIYVKQQTYYMKDYAIVKYDSLFNQRGITKEIFVENVKYYFTHKKHAGEIMNKIDELVEQRIAILRDSLNKQ